MGRGEEEEEEEEERERERERERELCTNTTATNLTGLSADNVAILLNTIDCTSLQRETTNNHTQLVDIINLLMSFEKTYQRSYNNRDFIFRSNMMIKLSY